MFLISFNKCFSQQFESGKNDETSFFKDSIYGITQIYEYQTHWLTFGLDTTELNDTIYLQNVIDFIESQNSLIKEIYIDTILRKTAVEFFENKNLELKNSPYDYSLDVRLSDTMNAYQYLDVFSFSRLFQFANYHTFINPLRLEKMNLVSCCVCIILNVQC